MCTAIALTTKDFYFGRTLDYECSYGEEITITPRSYPFSFRHAGTLDTHYAMIGMAHIAEGEPLYYEAVNEKGLGMAGLNFVGNAVYRDCVSSMDNIAQFEFIPWILAKCATVEDAKKLLQTVNLVNTPFNENYPLAQLHWLIADAAQSIVVEAVQDGLKIYDNPVGVLTNNPPFDKQLFGLNNYMHLSAKNPDNLFSGEVPLHAYSRGMGALGLPGDLSSQSRFIRASFVKSNSICGETEEESVSQYFHVIGSVEQQRGCCYVENGQYEITIYTSCCNASRGIYYYTTYGNHQITAVDMQKEDLDGRKIITYPLVQGEQIRWQNR